MELDKSNKEKITKSDELNEAFNPSEDNEESFLGYETFDPNEEIEESLVEYEFFNPNEDIEDFFEANNNSLGTNKTNRSYIEKTEKEAIKSDLNWVLKEEIGNKPENTDYDKEIIDGSEEITNRNYKYKIINYRNEDKEEETFTEIQKLKKMIKNIKWENITEDWSIDCQRYQNSEENIIHLDPKQDSSTTNPLYKHKEWLKKIYNDQNLNLNDTKIGKICNIHKSTIGRWRRIHNIPIKPSGSGQWGDKKGYVRMYMSEDYYHPELMSHRGEGKFIRFEHAVVMEQFLSEHPELDWSKKYLIDGKYLKKGTIIHHINYIHRDNRIDNLYIFENDAFHKNADKTLYNSFSKLIKLNKIEFKDGKYYINRNYNGKFNTSEIIETLKPVPINIYKDVSLVKEEIKKIRWQNISNDWTVKYRANKYTPYQTITLDPYSDCSDKNPLYRHKAWIDHLIHNEDFNLTDSRLGDVCGVSRAKIVYWRKRVHNIYSRSIGWGYKRYIQSNGRVWIKVPKDYKNPFTQNRNRYISEHRYIIEQYLSEHPELDISKKFLIDGKFLKSSCSVHHINLDHNYNQLDNLWICENESKHQVIQSSLLNFVDDLLKAKIIIFKSGEYRINVKKKKYSN